VIKGLPRQGRKSGTARPLASPLEGRPQAEMLKYQMDAEDGPDGSAGAASLTRPHVGSTPDTIPLTQTRSAPTPPARKERGG